MAYLYDTKLGVKRRLLKDEIPEIALGLPITKDDFKKLKALDLSAATFYCSDDVCALALMELDHLCNKNHTVRRCGRCGRYFLPHSKNTKYCDRFTSAERERTCKDVAAMVKYLDTIREDEAKALYRRYANNYQMRCRRAPACYSYTEYEAWKDKAKAHIEAYRNDEIDFEEFDKLIRLPEVR